MSGSIDMLENAAGLLEPLLGELVFVGGSVLPLYMGQDPGAEPPRTTEDVDCVIAAVTLREYHAFEDRLRSLGFKPCMEKGAPICRWWVGDTKVDFMPQNSDALGFTNPWYARLEAHRGKAPAFGQAYQNPFRAGLHRGQDGRARFPRRF